MPAERETVRCGMCHPFGSTWSGINNVVAGMGSGLWLMRHGEEPEGCTDGGGGSRTGRAPRMWIVDA